MDCLWIPFVPFGMIIRLDIIVADIHASDNIIAKRVIDPGHVAHSSYYSDIYFAIIYMRSDASLQSQGFHFNYVAIG